MVAVAWGALGYGLIFSPHNQQAWGDLEAGGRFAANFTVYLPYYALTLPIAAVVILGLLGRQNLRYPLVATTVAIALFAWWVAAQGLLFDAQPQLFASLAGCLIAEAVAVLALARARVMAEPPGGRYPLPVTMVRLVATAARVGVLGRGSRRRWRSRLGLRWRRERP